MTENIEIFLTYLVLFNGVMAQNNVLFTETNLTISATGNFTAGTVLKALDSSNTSCAIGMGTASSMIAFQFNTSDFTIFNISIITAGNVPQDMYNADSFSVLWGTNGNQVTCVANISFSATVSTATYNCPGLGSYLVLRQAPNKVMTICDFTIISKDPKWITGAANSNGNNIPPSYAKISIGKVATTGTKVAETGVDIAGKFIGGAQYSVFNWPIMTGFLLVTSKLIILL